MFFSLSKIFWLLAAPSHLLGWLILAAALCALAGRMRAVRWLVLAAAVLLLVAGVLPLNVWMIRALEDEYPRPPWPAHVDGIVVLGAGFDTSILKARGVPATNAGEMGVIAGVEAARRYPAARLVFSGGSGVLGGASGPGRKPKPRAPFSRNWDLTRRDWYWSRARATPMRISCSPKRW